MVEDHVRQLSDQVYQRKKDALLNSKILPNMIEIEEEKCSPPCNVNGKSVSWFDDFLIIKTVAESDDSWTSVFIYGLTGVLKCNVII